MARTEIEVRENVPLAPMTTLGVGGSARFFVRAESEGDVEEAVAFARDRGLEFFVLGGGSNLVIADRGFDGLVLQIAIGGITESQQEQRVLLDAGAGVNWDEFVALSVARGYGEVECLSGIPGS